MRYVFGPVPSRRLGRSLGVDPVPAKTCDWNCVYCQLGRTSAPTHARRAWVPTEALLEELRETLARHAGEIDWVTFSGSGEPTLHRDLGRMIRGAKAASPVPVAVITNGSTLALEEVREALLAADAVLPTVSAGSEEVWLRLHRPASASSGGDSGFERFVEGLVAFGEQYEGRLWPEVMLVAGINDDDGALADIAALLARIRPDEIHLLSPSRPPTEPWVQPVGPEVIARAAALLGAVATVVPPAEIPEAHAFAEEERIEEAVLSLIRRHPMREEELSGYFGRWTPEEVHAALSSLEADGTARATTRDDGRYWCAA